MCTHTQDTGLVEDPVSKFEANKSETKNNIVEITEITTVSVLLLQFTPALLRTELLPAPFSPPY